MYDLAAGQIESLGPGTIRVDAIRAASQPIPAWKTIDVDVVRLCEIAGAIVSRYTHSANGAEADYVSV